MFYKSGFEVDRLLGYVVSFKQADVSEVRTVSIIRAIATRLHGAISQKPVIFLLAAVRTSYLTKPFLFPSSSLHMFLTSSFYLFVKVITKWEISTNCKIHNFVKVVFATEKCCFVVSMTYDLVS
jgi:hypothetical protein